ncbi:hypothetical protein BGZ76_011112 [Entomortierella beljakovae]|nr:hypothetical protein BGZ76_011112 [Entomortierella beljakovae]
MSSPEDVIARHSDSLCQFFNLRHPEVIFALASLYSKQNVFTAVMVNIWGDGFTIDIHDKQGTGFQLSISFARTVVSLNDVKDVFLQMGEKAETESQRSLHRNIPGQPPGWRVYWPNWTPFLMFLAFGVLSFTYIAIFPDTNILPFKWTVELLGIDTIQTSLWFAFGLHAFQAITAVYLILCVAKCEFTIKQKIIWTLCVQCMGIGSMLKLLPIVYNSKFVSDEIDEENKRMMDVLEV